MSANKELLKVSVYLDPEDLLDPKFITSEDDLLSITINELYASSEYYDDTLFTYTEIDENTRDLFFDVFLKELKENELNYNKNGYGDIFDILDLKIDTMNFVQTEDDCLEYIFPVEIDFDAMKEWLQEKGLMKEQKPHFAYDIDYAYDDDEIEEMIQNLDNEQILEMFDIDAHVEKIRKVYGHRAGVMVQAMKDYFPEEVTFTDPDGGLFTWAELPDYIDTKVMASQCLAKNVAYVPGAGFFPNGGNNHCMRLNYSCSGDEQIVNGIHIIGDIIKANLK